jgi:hypothetical protein
MRALARLITVGGPQAARAVCALASLASAVPLIRLRYEQPRHTRPVSGSGARQVSEGLRALGPDTGLRLIAPLGFVQTFLRGCATVLVIVVAIDLLGGGDADIGVLNAAIGLGTLVGSLLASTITLEWPSRPLPRRRRPPLRRPDRPSSAERPRRPPRCCWSPPSASASARRRRCLHAARAPRARRRDTTHVRNPRSALDARRRVRRGRHVALIALLGSRGALLALRVGGPAAVATAWPALRALDRRMAGRDVTSSCCTRLHSGPLPQSTIEDVAASLERVVFAPRATVFEEGEAGESFHIVGAGHAQVTRRGGHVGQLGNAATSARPSCCAATCRAPRRCEQPTTRSFMSACWPASASSPP